MWPVLQAMEGGARPTFMTAVGSRELAPPSIYGVWGLVSKVVNNLCTNPQCFSHFVHNFL